MPLGKHVDAQHPQRSPIHQRLSRDQRHHPLYARRMALSPSIPRVEIRIPGKVCPAHDVGISRDRQRSLDIEPRLCILAQQVDRHDGHRPERSRYHRCEGRAGRPREVAQLSFDQQQQQARPLVS